MAGEQEARLTLPQALERALHSATPKSLKELSSELGVSEKLLPDALLKLGRSLSKTPERLQQVAAQCIACGFDFVDRARAQRPSRCPRCRSERIAPAKFWIE